jgi:hypothetical protein
MPNWTISSVETLNFFGFLTSDTEVVQAAVKEGLEDVE